MHSVKRSGTYIQGTVALLKHSDFRVDGAKSPEIPQKEGASGSDIATRNRKLLAAFHRTLKSQCGVSEIASDFWVRDGHRNRQNRQNRCDFGALRLRSAWQLKFSALMPFTNLGSH